MAAVSNGQMPQIRDVLRRRSDLSTFVVHLTRSRDGKTAKEAFRTIVSDRCVRAGSARGWAYMHDAAADRQHVVCFSETPLEHLHCLLGPIYSGVTKREYELEPWGLAFTKVTARRLGINPVWYFDLHNGGGDGVIKRALDDLRDLARADPAGFASHPASRIFPFIEQMGRSSDGTRYEWWWEREWRHFWMTLCSRTTWLG